MLVGGIGGVRFAEHLCVCVRWCQSWFFKLAVKHIFGGIF